MAYEYITQYDSPNYFTPAQCLARYGRKRQITGITVHWWGLPENKPTFQGVIDYLCRPNGNTSAHEVIEAGRVAPIVNHINAAWHSGSSVGNATTIGLELNPRCSDGDYETAGERIADLWIGYGNKLPLYKHSDWKNTRCPGNYDLARLRKIAEKYYQIKVNGSKPEPKPEPEPVIEELIFMEPYVAYANAGSAYYLITPGSPKPFGTRLDKMTASTRKRTITTDDKGVQTVNGLIHIEVGDAAWPAFAKTVTFV